jgi:glutamate synthase (NADPH/NADH) large chain
MTDQFPPGGASAVSPFTRFAGFPADTGLYRAENEKDACGLAVIATLRGEPGHDIVDAALTALRNLEHRGAVGADEGTGDGAGLLTQVPDEFFRAVTAFELPAAGTYAVGTAFLPTEGREQDTARAGVEAIAESEGLTVLGWREVPIVGDLVGAMSRACMPHFVQVFLAPAWTPARSA